MSVRAPYGSASKPVSRRPFHHAEKLQSTSPSANPATVAVDLDARERGQTRIEAHDHLSNRSARNFDRACPVGRYFDLNVAQFDTRHVGELRRVFSQTRVADLSKFLRLVR